MSKTFEQGKEEIARIVDHFGKHTQFYRSGEYREANARQELIDPMFMALGWDVRNENHTAPQYREVVSETSVEIEGHKKSPDYVFRVGQTSKFFAEAKKPSVSIKNDPLPAQQLRHYAWNAKLPLSVLTDFDEFAVYHCRIRPKPGDKAAIARVNFLTFDEYPDRWRELWDVFSRDAVWGGEFDRYAQTSLGKRGTSEVDAEFLKEIEGWRELLARNIAIRNTKISIEELNAAVQLTIDRIIFLRMAEDRGIEPYEQLKNLAKNLGTKSGDMYSLRVPKISSPDFSGNSIYNRFIKGPCRKADEKYNSGLFDFTKDKLTPRLDIDDKVIEGILKRLYFPESPYNFRLMPVEILGNVYEQFLGKVIRLTEGHHAKIEEKPEVKKAGGVYYTPAYIVEYIVKNTVGAMLAHNFNCRPLTPTLSPWEREKKEVASPLLPPLPRSTALPPLPRGEGWGEGTTIVGTPPLPRGEGWGEGTTIVGTPPLPRGEGWGEGTTIVGTPPLPRGEGWGEGTTIKIAAHEDTQQKKRKDKFPADLFDFRVLDMACGSGSFLLGAYKYLLDFYLKWYTENKPEKSPKAVWKQGGEWRLTIGEKKRILLTHIFGVDIDRQAVEVTKLSLLLKVLEGESDETLMKQQQFELWQDRALPDLDKNIKCGNSLIGTDYFTDRLIPDPIEMRRVNPFDWDREFPEAMKAGGFDCIIGNPPYVMIGKDIFSENIIEYFNSYQVAQYKADLYHLFIQKGIILLKNKGSLGYITPNTWFTLPYTAKLREYVLKHSQIEELVIFDHLVFQNADVHTGLIFLKKSNDISKHSVLIKSFPKIFISEMLYRPSAKRLMQKEWLEDPNFCLEVRLVDEAGRLAKRVKEKFPSLEKIARASLGAQAYNSSKHTPEQIEKRVFHSTSKLSKEYLRELAGNDVARYQINRIKGQWIKYGPWLHDYRTMDWLTGPRILMREIAGKWPYRICACYVEETFCNYKTILNINPSAITDFSMKYLLGIINSKLISFLFPLLSSKIVAGSFPRLSVRDVKLLPIRPINFSDPTDKARHDRMVSLVEQMLELHRRKADGKGEADREVYDRQIAATDGEIDRLVYELYGLTEDEIKIVEGNQN